ncbi:MAG: hypothetical protein ABS944_07225 [Solibacillus sp.]|jgi:hypothetical protein|uniref:hypothetical protein n=1 Tax=Solibacillus sp. TaxID=1909654 RepID=UPI0033155E24
MKKIVYLLLIITAIGIIVTYLWNRASQDEIVAKEIETLLKQGETQIDLTNIAVFRWTQVGLFGPYTTNEMIEESMEIKFKGDNGGIDILDDRFLLVFANDKYAIKTVILPRKFGTYTIKDNTFLIVKP